MWKWGDTQNSLVYWLYLCSCTHLGHLDAKWYGGSRLVGTMGLALQRDGGRPQGLMGHGIVAL